MGNVVRLTSPERLDDLWEDYVRLARAMNDDRRLAEDREHIQATIRAHRKFATAFLASERRA